MKKKKYTYVPNKSIENVITTNASFTGDELLDGVYLRGRKNFADGGMMAKGGTININEDYKIVIKKTNSPSNYNLFASLFKKGERLPLIGTTFKSTDTKEDIKEWFEQRMKNGSFEDYIYSVSQLPSDEESHEEYAEGGKMAKGGRTKSKYTYVPNRNIENVITTNSSFSGDELLDGVYLKGRKKFKDGGKVVKKMGDRAVAEKIMEMDAKAWEDLDIKSGSQLRADKDLQRKYLDRMFEADKVLARAKNPKRVMDILEDENYHSAWGTLYTKGKSPYPVFAEGGEMRKLRHRSLNRRAEELVGDEAWDSLSTEDQTELAAELVAEGVLAVPVLEDGGMMADGGKIAIFIEKENDFTQQVAVVENYAEAVEKVKELKEKYKDTDIKYKVANIGMMADGAEVADAKYVITYELDGKKKEKLFDDKDKAESFMELMGSEDDVTNMKLTEKKPAKAKKAEPAAAPVNLFAKPAIGQAKPAKKPSDRQDVPVKGIGPAIARYDALKEIIKNAEAEKELLDGQIKEVGRDKFLEMYKDEGFRPKNFNIVDGGEKILYVTSDTYQGSRYGLSPEKISLLEQYDDILESETTYTINAKVLNKPGVAEAISKMIMSSKILTDEDKAELIQAETKTVVRKGTIDRLLQYPDPAVIFDLIDPTVSLR